MTKPWVSILTPLYNGVEFLEECAMSVCLQNCNYETTHFTWEWWIGVNGHGDGGDVLRRAQEIQYKCKESIGDCVIHVVNLPDVRGKVETLNTLVECTEGEWIAILDCDDTWERDKLLYQRLTIERSPIKLGVVGTLCRYFGDLNINGPPLPAGLIEYSSVWFGNPIINSSALIRRDLAHWEDRFGLEDYDMWLRIAKTERLFNIPKLLVNHRIHAGSAFNGKGKQNISGLLSYHIKHI